MNAQTEVKAAMSASHKNVFVALAAAQMEMDPLTKGALNPAFKGEGKPKGTAYADLADVVQAVRHALNANGLAFFHQLIPGDVHIMRTVLVHGESESRIECDVPLIVSKNDMQGMKSATTYAKRIGLESVTGVAPEDDDGNAAVVASPRRDTARDAEIKHENACSQACAYIEDAKTLTELQAAWSNLPKVIKSDERVIGMKEAQKAKLSPAANADLAGDEIPY
jgi:hypothetical protein